MSYERRWLRFSWADIRVQFAANYGDLSSDNGFLYEAIRASSCCLRLMLGWTMSHSALPALMYNPSICPVLLFLLTFPGKPLGDRHMDLRCYLSDASISLSLSLYT